MHSIACVQFCPAWKDVESNLTYLVRRLQTLPRVDLAVFPELALTGYVFEYRNELKDLAFEIDNPVWDPFRDLSVKKDMAIVLGAPIREGAAIYNSALIFLPDRSLHVYHKIHLFDKEKELFAPGDQKPAVYEVHGMKFGVLICFDWAFPEIWRYLAMEGADLVCLPSNLVLPGKGQKGIMGHALCNRIYVALANRYGREGNLSFTGNSRIVGPDGEIVAETPGADDRVAIGHLDIEIARHKKVTQRNHLFQDRRPSLY